jgi:hypothetical protein
MKLLRLLPLLALVLACGDFSTTVRPTSLTMTVNRPSGAVGQPFEFSYSATGRSMAGLIIDYGDGGLDSLGFQGAVTATGRREHTYSQPGTYLVSGLLEDFLAGSSSAQISVAVIP